MMDEEEDEYNDFSYQPESIEESAVNSKSIKEINNEINSEKGYDDFDNTKEIEEELFHSIKEKITQKNEESKKEDYEDSAKIDDFIEKILNQQEDSNEKNEIIKKKSTQEEIQTQIDKSNIELIEIELEYSSVLKINHFFVLQVVLNYIFSPHK